MEILRKIIATFTRLLITAACVTAIGGVFSNSGWPVLWMVVPILVLLFVLYKKRMAWRFIIGFYSFWLMIPSYALAVTSKEWHTLSLWGVIIFTLTFFGSFPVGKKMRLFISNETKNASEKKAYSITISIFFLTIIALVINFFISSSPWFGLWKICLVAIAIWGLVLTVLNENSGVKIVGVFLLLLDSIPVFITTLIVGGAWQVPLIAASVVTFITSLKILINAEDEEPPTAKDNLSAGVYDMSRKTKNKSSADESLYSVAVLATMSAGKSTLLNSIIGKDILPSRNEACTSTVFQIEDYDDATEFTARSVDKKGATEWIRIEKNTLEDWNNKNLQQIEIRGNLPNISNIDGKYRVMFFDTPGPNNSLEEEHSKIADKILRKSDYCAMLCVLNASVLGVDDEWKLLSHIQKVIAKRDLDIQPIFVVNKVDLLDIEKGEDPIDILERMKVYLEDLKFESPFLIPVSSKSSLFLRTSIKEKEKMTISEKLSESTGVEKILAIFSTRFKSTLTVRQQKSLRDTITFYKDLSTEYIKMYSSFPEFRSILETLLKKHHPMQNLKIKIAGEYFLIKDFYQADILTGIPILERILENNFNKHVCNIKQTTQGDKKC